MWEQQQGERDEGERKRREVERWVEVVVMLRVMGWREERLG